MRLAIVMPSGDMVHADTAMCLAQMVNYLAHWRYQIALVSPRSSLVQKGRYDGVKDAQKINADAVLFIDSDMTFPADAACRLINHNQPIVGACASTRRYPFRLTAKDAGLSIQIQETDTGLRPVSTLGTGFLLVSMEVFNKLPEPWFKVEFDNGHWTSEDESFCNTAMLAGYDVLVDVDLSKEIGHIGTMTVGVADAMGWA